MHSISCMASRLNSSILWSAQGAYVEEASWVQLHWSRELRTQKSPSALTQRNIDRGHAVVGLCQDSSKDNPIRTGEGEAVISQWEFHNISKHMFLVAPPAGAGNVSWGGLISVLDMVSWSIIPLNSGFYPQSIWLPPEVIFPFQEG